MIVATSSRNDRTPAAPSAAAPLGVALVGVCAWALVVALGRRVGLDLMDDGVDVVLFTPPVLGGERTGIPRALWLPIVVAVALVVGLPPATERLRWRACQAATASAALTWWVALALVDGRGGLTRGLHWTADYSDSVPRAAVDAGGFLDTYVQQLPGYPIALRGHPPGFVLFFALLDRVGLPGPGWAAVSVLLGGAVGVIAVLTTVRTIAGEQSARRAAPFVALAPAALWIATSTDALTMGTGAATIALVTVAGTRHDRGADVLAALAGLLAAFTALQSYGLVLLALPVVVVAAWQRRLRPLVVATTVALVATAALLPAGFWWFDGLEATVHEYRTLDLERPYAPFLVINLAAWSLALGPATAAGLAALRDRRLWVVVGGGLLAAGAAELSGLSSGEVERIWLPFTVWVLPAAASLATSRRATRVWLVVQVLTALTVTSLIGTNW